MNLKKELEQRGFIYQKSSENVFEKFEKGGENFYCGFDPTADSLHLGNFIGFMLAIHLMKQGNKYFALVGGATGMIGDPGGKESERTFLSEENLRNNEKSIKNQISKILSHLEKTTGNKFDFEVVNNVDFYKGFLYLDFLREVGKYITVNQMMAKDTVKKRITDPDKSISYTEFSYMLLQGYDFYRLFSDKNVILQVGGQDQWGNIVTGVELTRKKTDKEVYALTFPLLVDSTGKKFGKSEGNALWLDRNKTSPYKLYQYFLNTADDDLEKYLKILTLVDLKEIKVILDKHLKNPGERYAQKTLAYKVVEIIHSQADSESSSKITEILFGNEDKVSIIKNTTKEELDIFYNELGGLEYSGENLFELIVKSGLATSNSEARKAIESGAFYINEQKVIDTKYDFSNDFINGKVLLLRKGKKTFKLIIKK
nr:tyrosine--tRNA ligase [Candidatus Gracilibacteria bacterium]